MNDARPPLVSASLPAKGETRGTVVLLHGLGADEDDLLGLALELPRDLRYVCVRAPIQLPWGGFAWYPLAAPPVPGAPSTGGEEIGAVTDSLHALCAWLRMLPEPAERIVLVGFSQGAVMTAGVLCRADIPALAGYALLSGYLHPSVRVPSDLGGRNVFVAHGREDAVLDVGFGRESRTRLAAAGARTLYREYAAGHTICPEELDDLRDWLDATLVSKPNK